MGPVYTLLRVLPPSMTFIHVKGGLWNLLIQLVSKSKFNLATSVSSGYLEAPSRLVVLITHQHQHHATLSLSYSEKRKSYLS